MAALARNVIAFGAWILVAGTLVQVFLAGLGVFRGPADFETHRNFGYLLGLFTLGLLILAVAVHATRFQMALAALLFVQFIAQSVLVNLRATNPELAALHPVNGTLIVIVAILFARHSWRLAGRTAQ
jgi:hypothetical protein